MVEVEGGGEEGYELLGGEGGLVGGWKGEGGRERGVCTSSSSSKRV